MSLDKYVKIMAAVVLTAIVGGAAARFIGGIIYAARCPMGDTDYYASMCSLSMSVENLVHSANELRERTGEEPLKPSPDPEGKNACWCAGM